MSEEKIVPIVVGAALKSMRNHGFDMQTAICEVIDNSLQANSKNIKIKIKYSDESTRKKNRPVEIAFGDDGDGMDSQRLQYCLKLGYSGRYDDRNGIGRFGVGMTYAAISLCQKIDVYSRERQGNWQYTSLDISRSNNDEEPGILKITPKPLPEEYAELVGDYGTLVIWSMIDRIDEPVNEKELIHNMGRIYRKFLGSEIIKKSKLVTNKDQCKLYLNNHNIRVFDPLYVIRNPDFPDDEVATIDDETSFEWNVHGVDAPTSGAKRGTITIRTSLLPEAWRRIRSKTGRPGSGRSSENLRRKVNENEGLSILRRGREVSYGQILRLLTKDREIDRFWSCEIDFDPVLDHWFSVRSVKIGAKPLTALKEELKRRIRPSVERFRDQITKTMDEYDREESKSEQGPIRGHATKEKELSSNTSPPIDTSTPEEQKQQAKKTAQSTFEGKNEQDEYIDKVSDPQNKYNVIEVSNMRSDAPFFEIVPNLATKVTHYNMNHAFFLDVYETLKNLQESIQNDNVEHADTLRMVDHLRGCLDNLFHAYGEAYYDMDDLDKEQKIRDTFDEFFSKWNLHLRLIYKH